MIALMNRISPNVEAIERKTFPESMAFCSKGCFVIFTIYKITFDFRKCLFNFDFSGPLFLTVYVVSESSSQVSTETKSRKRGLRFLRFLNRNLFNRHGIHIKIRRLLVAFTF